MDFVFLADVAQDEGVVDIGDITVFFRKVIINIGSSKATVHDIMVKGEVVVARFVVLKIFAEGERKDFDGKSTSSKEGGEIAGEEEGV